MIRLGAHRADIPIGQSTDANGNAVIQQQFVQWSIIDIAADVASGLTTDWKLYVSPTNEAVPGTLKGHAIGPSVTGGPFIVAPNEWILLVVSGAGPNSIVSGSLFGIQNVDPSNLPIVTSAPTLTGGLASATSAAISQMQPVASIPLVSGGSVVINTAANPPPSSPLQTWQAYPGGAQSWTLLIVAPANTTLQVDVTAFSMPNGVQLWRRRRATSPLKGNLVAMGSVDSGATTFTITASTFSGSATAYLFMAGTPVPDSWFDTAIYDDTGAGSSNGYDGRLFEWINVGLAGNSNTLVTLPTYRGWVQLGMNVQTSSLTLTFQAYEYLGAGQLSNGFAIGGPVGTSNILFHLPGNYNKVNVGVNGAGGATVYLDMSAVNDLE